MTQRNNGAVSFQADGKTYTLVCDMNALADFEAQCRCRAFEVLGVDLNELSIVHQRGLFWSMLQEHHSDITLRGAGRLLARGKVQMLQALKSAFPEPDEGKETEKQMASQTEAS